MVKLYLNHGAMNVALKEKISLIKTYCNYI